MDIVSVILNLFMLVLVLIMISSTIDSHKRAKINGMILSSSIL
ncbi:hypothetical protein [Oceanirhabdus sp. W0125-5]|nr:hypothetical protein [Oceanirhabdus sp. W0125-5]WBW94705.1 hypothetical protein OW730_13470 [Oceanirhabdus sp. W0125-5]